MSHLEEEIKRWRLEDARREYEIAERELIALCPVPVPGARHRELSLTELQTLERHPAQIRYQKAREAYNAAGGRALQYISIGYPWYRDYPPMYRFLHGL